MTDVSKPPFPSIINVLRVCESATIPESELTPEERKQSALSSVVGMSMDRHFEIRHVLKQGGWTD